MTRSIRAAQWCAARLAQLGFDGIRCCGTGIGRLIWWCAPSRKRLAIKNIKKHLGCSEEEAARIAHTSFMHNGRSFLECVLIPQFGLDHPRLHVPRPDLLERVRHADQPIVIVAGHLGAWELLAGALGEATQDRPRACVVRTYRNAVLEAVSSSLRSSKGTQVLGHRDAAFAVLRILKRKGIVAFLVDHNTHRDEACFLPFLGEEAAVNKGPALLAVRAKAEVWPIFLFREGGSYVLHMEEPLLTANLEGELDDRVEQTARFYTEAVERAVRMHPEQWFWMHNRWKTKRQDDD